MMFLLLHRCNARHEPDIRSNSGQQKNFRLNLIMDISRDYAHNDCGYFGLEMQGA